MAANNISLKSIKKISVIGDGGWGTTLAIHLVKKGYNVNLWGAFPQYIAEVARTRVNSKFLPGVKIPAQVTLEADLAQALQGTQVVLLAIPSKYIVPILEKIRLLDLKGKVILSVVKGIDEKTLLRMSEIIEKHLGSIPVAVLSGPTIAIEVARGIPSTAVVACQSLPLAKTLQSVIHSSTFRIYTNQDVIGVELGGSNKNIIAIACGICDGLKLGTNAKAAVLARGLSEMARLGERLGAKKETFYGLTGLGDLVTTCFSPKSRNRSVGELLGQGKTLKQITQNMEMVAEGVETVKGTYLLSRRLKISMPITEEIYKILYQNKSPRKAVSDLMNRALKSE